MNVNVAFSAGVVETGMGTNADIGAPVALADGAMYALKRDAKASRERRSA